MEPSENGPELSSPARSIDRSGAGNPWALLLNSTWKPDSEPAHASMAHGLRFRLAFGLPAREADSVPSGLLFDRTECRAMMSDGTRMLWNLLALISACGFFFCCSSAAAAAPEFAAAAAAVEWPCESDSEREAEDAQVIERQLALRHGRVKLADLIALVAQLLLVGSLAGRDEAQGRRVLVVRALHAAAADAALELGVQRWPRVRDSDVPAHLPDGRREFGPGLRALHQAVGVARAVAVTPKVPAAAASEAAALPGVPVQLN
ncbi:hypothetical protein AXG93_3571s1020 [Marchantia polymorpha subsp. ruderalis]|uniref:Uncharacterized protein n=1 Tax=Marchantia polymorpha subsp. ruderalis TaxID=1480154 RepID=A0A176VQ81_MARPO|nr:hypothetical protein AXG93_3571s1020 [Marchantia polymorpha subsp. ruderalis]